MPARTSQDGHNWADEIQYKLFVPEIQKWVNISLDDAVGCVVDMTEVHPVSGEVIVWVKALDKARF